MATLRLRENTGTHLGTQATCNYVDSVCTSQMTHIWNVFFFSIYVKCHVKLQHTKVEYM
jgi:hypothetical protein